MGGRNQRPVKKRKNVFPRAWGRERGEAYSEASPGPGPGLPAGEAGPAPPGGGGQGADRGRGPGARGSRVPSRSQEGARGRPSSLTASPPPPRSERQLPLPQPQGRGVEQPGPQQLPRRRPARGQRAGEGGLGAGSQIRAGEEAGAPPGGPRGFGRRRPGLLSEPRPRGSPGRLPVTATSPGPGRRGRDDAQTREGGVRPRPRGRGPGAAAQEAPRGLLAKLLAPRALSAAPVWATFTRDGTASPRGQASGRGFPAARGERPARPRARRRGSSRTDGPRLRGHRRAWRAPRPRVEGSQRNFRQFPRPD